MRRLFVLILFVAAAAYAEPETVIVNYYPKPGKDADVLRSIHEAWRVMTKLNLVTGDHQLYQAQSEGGGRTFYVEILTWRDASIPDNIPAEVKKVWGEMNANTAKLDIFELKPVQ